MDRCAFASPDEAIVVAQSELELDGAKNAGGSWERAFPPVGKEENQDLMSFLRQPMRRTCCCHAGRRHFRTPVDNLPRRMIKEFVDSFFICLDV